MRLLAGLTPNSFFLLVAFVKNMYLIDLPNQTTLVLRHKGTVRCPSILSDSNCTAKVN